jgi:hypothetical protein
MVADAQDFGREQRNAPLRNFITSDRTEKQMLVNLAWRERNCAPIKSCGTITAR